MARHVAALLALACVATPPVWAQRQAAVTVRPEVVVGPVNPLVFGNNMLAYQGGRDEYSNRGAGIWDPDSRRPVPEYVELSRLAGVTVHRWPGGCGAHNYNWKLTVGPLAQRPDMQFGLPEFLAFCEATDAVPLLTIAVYWGDEQDGADLVEYLNSPNDGSNPNGGEDWAAVRAADGHPEPYDVVWFEYGNESYHGEHKSAERPNPRIYTGEQYAELYLRYREAMRAVDPGVKLGALIQNGLREWNEQVLAGCGSVMDFAIEHTYKPGCGNEPIAQDGHLLMQACTASDADIQRVYDDLLGLIREKTGREDVLLAITEYNGHFVQEEPVPYRQSLGNALRNAEHLRVMLRPENRILMANFWQFSNEYWGMVKGYVHKGERPALQANFLVFQLYARHFGDTLVGVDVDCETWDFAGGAWLTARRGKPSRFLLYEANLLPEDYTWEDRRPEGDVKQTVEGPVVTAQFSGTDVNYYAPRIALPARADTGYRLTGWVKTEGLSGERGAGFQVGDARGWTVTRSCTLGGDVRGDADWTRVQVDYVTLGDTTGIEVLARKLDGSPTAGKAAFRLESVQEFRPERSGAVPDLGVNAATRADGTITLMIVNKNIDEAVATSIRVPAGPEEGKARAWLLSGPSPTTNNLSEPREIAIRETGIEVREGAYRIVLPACSMAAVEVRAPERQ